MFKILVTLFLFCFSTNGLFSQHSWAYKIGSPGSDVGQKILVKNDKVYTLGNAGYLSDINPGPSVEEVYFQFYVHIMSEDGLMENIFSGPQEATDMDIDDGGNIYVIGHFNTAYTYPIAFGPDSSSVELTSQNLDSFIAKYDSTGNFIWVKQLTGEGNIKATAIQIDDNQNLILFGEFSDEIDLDPGQTENFLTATDETSSGNNDGFLLKLDSSGNYMQSVHLDDKKRLKGCNIETGSDNSIYVRGNYTGQVNFYNSSDTISMSTGTDYQTSSYLAKFDPNLNLVWVKDYSSNNLHSANLVIGNNDITYILKVDFGSLSQSLVAVDNDGNELWSNPIQHELSDYFGYGHNLAAGPNHLFLYSTKSGSFYITKYSLDGNPLAFDYFSCTKDLKVNSMFVRDSNNILMAGYFRGILEFPAENESIKLSYDGSSDYEEGIIFPDAFHANIHFKHLNFDNYITAGSELQLFPNPAKTYIQLNLIPGVNTEIQLFDLQGQLVSKKWLNGYESTIDIRDLEVGTYVLKVKMSNSDYITKFVKI